MAKMFGTNGVRGIVGDTMTPEFAHKLGRATAAWMGGQGTMAVGRDARASGPALQEGFEAGLHEGGVNTIDLGIAPTPGIQWWIRQADVAAGAVITASHNPPEWNGIKILEGDGTDALPETERAIEAQFDSIAGSGNGGGRRLEAVDPNPGYIDAVVGLVDASAIRAAKLTAVLDPGGGAGCVTAPTLLEALGVTIIPVSCELDPDFSDRPSEPTEANAAACMAAVKEHHADLGILQDGDADRAVFVDETGAYVDGNKGLALMAGFEMERVDPAERIVCTPVSTSSATVDAVESRGGRIEWTIVGSPPVARAMRETGSPFGGEGNGGFLFARHQFGKDGLMAMARLLEVLATTGQPLSALVAQVPRYAFAQDKIPVPQERKAEILAAFKEALADVPGITGTDDRDGVKANLGAEWVLVRPSGTEAIYRVQAEAQTPEAADALVARFKAILESLL